MVTNSEEWKGSKIAWLSPYRMYFFILIMENSFSLLIRSFIDKKGIFGGTSMEYKMRKIYMFQQYIFYFLNFLFFSAKDKIWLGTHMEKNVRFSSYKNTSK